MPYKDPEVRKQKAKAYNRKYYEKNKKAVIAESKARKREVRAEWHAFKATLFCAHCGEGHPAVLDFHHTVRDKSNRKLHELITNGNIRGAMAEIKKCIVLCANCHRKHHWEEYQQKKRGPKPP